MILTTQEICLNYKPQLICTSNSYIVVSPCEQHFAIVFVCFHWNLGSRKFRSWQAIPTTQEILAPNKWSVQHTFQCDSHCVNLKDVFANRSSNKTTSRLDHYTRLCFITDPRWETLKSIPLKAFSTLPLISPNLTMSLWPPIRVLNLPVRPVHYTWIKPIPNLALRCCGMANQGPIFSNTTRAFDSNLRR